MGEEIKKQRSEAARLMGQSRTEKKIAAAKENGKKGGRPRKLISELPCTCGGEGENHTFRCPKGRALAHRKAKNLPLD